LIITFWQKAPHGLIETPLDVAEGDGSGLAKREVIKAHHSIE
jgi:hypothetical protein